MAIVPGLQATDLSMLPFVLGGAVELLYLWSRWR
jgi:hypothetical protein